MNELQKSPVSPDGWESLKTFTQARIALGRTGVSIPLRESLAFKLAHAHAKDAVYSSLDTNFFMEKFTEYDLPFFLLKSKAAHRDEYLQRPDLGRRLQEESRKNLAATHLQPADIAIVIADGLSASAVNTHAWPLIRAFRAQALAQGFTFSPLVLVQQARVAISDEIGTLLQVKMVVQLIGERPGLSSSDSMGAYVTYAPEPGLTDERRNCISNIRPQGLGINLAVDKLMYLTQQAFRLQLTGVALKDDAPDGTETLKQ
ncbi:ethanolamine ammonia-lyase subunit EutC [Siphonobacter sp. SORGH_AS_0500]|uniref:ethanolamine ammonia-lyase subunit EutC n=1 Tax=Siphonobacter sp. SORGH_AS_0500 TaxID=1864824 RepID=UPI00286219D8|nr:ethanolamine ammonia-lyase subunit EutC [Siphonobacter sp. SORGH_AS_0500]MDR6197402.1 ethanolamine ammonia-lyase small subunit [Siphonobacter sp. SORGH_AS_0500]